jgi:chemotaxis protein methyltransferase WspC
MPKRLIAQRLKNAMGLHTPTVGMITVSSAIENRMRDLEIEEDQQYLEILDNDASEIQNLIEAVIIPETWFFRDKIAYKKLLEYLNKKKTTASYDHKAPLRILSIPCSSGEEPYSIAMLLTDSGFNNDEYKIDAVDISENLIRRAEEGVYRKHSFRADDLSFVDRHFSEHDGQFKISYRIKERVNFHHANLLDRNFLPGHEIYDVIFCRNLLIYFDETTQAQVFSVLSRLLKNDGILILGHAETSQKSAGLFEAANELGAYINRKTPKVAEAAGDEKDSPVNAGRVRSASGGLPEIPGHVAHAIPDTLDNDDKLEIAFALADEGRIEEAIEMSLAYIKRDRFSSRAHYLLGLLHDSNGDTSLADDYLKKALYLDPNNVESLIHLSLMAEQRGDTEDSERLRNRAERVQNKSGL